SSTSTSIWTFWAPRSIETCSSRDCSRGSSTGTAGPCGTTPCRRCGHERVDPAREELMTMRVLLATDGSSDAQSASAWRASFPLPAGTIVRAVPVATVAPSPLDIPTVRDFQAALHQEARAVADATGATLAAPERTVEARVLEGDPREELVRAAEEWPADLIVL